MEKTVRLKKKHIVRYYNARYSRGQESPTWFGMEGIMREWAAIGGIKKGKKMRVADIACGSGEFLEFLSKEFPDLELYGLDISPEAVNIARRKIPSARIVVGEGDKRSRMELCIF